MEVFELNGKNQEKLLEDLLEKYQLDESEIIFKINEKQGGIFKSTSYTISAAKLNDICEFIKEFLQGLLTKMGLEISFEEQIANNQIYIKMSSSNNSILIGKSGQTLNALQTICRQVVSKEISMLPQIILDVENYKDIQIKHIEKLAIKVAKEVKSTGIDAHLENMNSYQRRIVHNILLDFKGITTESEGIEPNRHVVIKKKK